MNNPIYPGITLNNHYRIVRELGHGGFGRTYLAEDAHRFNEPCVLKEFAPQVHGSYALQKSEQAISNPEKGKLTLIQTTYCRVYRCLTPIGKYSASPVSVNVTTGN